MATTRRDFLHFSALAVGGAALPKVSQESIDAPVPPQSPDRQALAAALRWVCDHPEEARARGARLVEYWHWNTLPFGAEA